MSLLTDCWIDWGDGSPLEHVYHMGVPGDYWSYGQMFRDHTYEVAGDYEVKITGQIFGWSYMTLDYAYMPGVYNLVEILEWGDTEWNILDFTGCSNLEVITAADAPDLAHINEGSTNAPSDKALDNFFGGCSKLTGGVANFDVSPIKTLSSFFYSATAFDDDLSAWDFSGLDDQYSLHSFMQYATGFSTANYDKLLINFASYGTGWLIGTVFETPAKYTGSSAASAARTYLISQCGWTINDGGSV